MADLAQLVSSFQNAELLANHDAHAEYLDNLEALCLRMAMMARLDSDIGATWLAQRRPRTGRLPWRERIQIARRTRAHGRFEARCWKEAAIQIRRWREAHEEFVRAERRARRSKPS